MKFPISLVILGLSGLAASEGLSDGLSFPFMGQKAVGQDDKKVPVPGDSPLVFCAASQDDDLVVLEKVNLTPNPPVAGEKLTIEAIGTVKQDIEQGAFVNLQVKYGLIKLVNTQADLCDQIANVDLSCPIQKGKISIIKDVELPKEIPPGKYTVQADAYTVDKEKLTCLEAEVTFHIPSRVDL